MRVAESLNSALHAVFAADPDVYLLGEDVQDPYGGAFKITKGLSTRFPGRVVPTPISEGGIVGVAGGLALAGNRAVAEIMFADFAALAFDQLLNFAAKSVSMYGRRVALPLLVRCPTGGGRGYGPTHSQSLQKHFIGIPDLAVFEVSPFDDHRSLFEAMLARGEPCVLFEDKVLYTRPMFADGIVDDLFRYDVVGETAVVRAGALDGCDCALIVPGGLVHRALEAMRTLLLDDEITCVLVVPRRLHPFDADQVVPLLGRARGVVVAEDGTAGGTWGGEVAHLLHRRLWERLRRPVGVVHAADSVIPTAAHLERDTMVRADDIRRAVLEALGV